MEGRYKERWQQLCVLVAEEKNPVRFEQLCKELIAELDKKDARLKMVVNRNTADDEHPKKEA